MSTHSTANMNVSIMGVRVGGALASLEVLSTCLERLWGLGVPGSDLLIIILCLRFRKQRFIGVRQTNF